ncbi:5-methyltetrahydropteroyltriglutamate--homocysteine S-methyltransferase [Hydrogenothermus marinus]|uniref:5-methyltetrahydropteroyltriglutamate--homocysteine methyltransferase n=1 Tax=Hydrogenothermus marinus TaxID=133270 RepID=A0A3M0BL06_9AQUI|nr:5-methyltetrahydropteroyltriglutamate--homocysteine S-methyltransferase [Hydrogenothermus marinus]RMA97114.1 methionine synthase (B12-independent) [Hydrogenothermus marinus]
MAVKTTIFGYPKIGPNRELKKAIESYWKGEISKEEMLKKVEEVDIDRMKRVINADLDYIPSNDFSLYDFVLDVSTMVDMIPKRFRNIEDGLDRYFAMARGTKDAIACEMTKWFDTNYHYIVPEIEGAFKLVKNRPLDSYKWAKEKLGVETKPVLVGAFTYLMLSKVYERQEGSLLMKMVKAEESEKFKPLLFELASVYNQMLRELQEEGVKAVQFDEPALVLDLDEDKINALIDAYRIITEGITDIEIFVHTYYESLDHFEKITKELPVSGIGLDFVVNNENLENLKKYGFPEDKKLQAGVISGRDPWKTDYKQVLNLIEEIKKYVSEDRIILSNAAPLFHLPVSLESEKGHLNEDLLELLSFADERLEEIKTLKQIINKGKEIPSQTLQEFRDKFKNEEVQKAIEDIDNHEIKRPHDFKERYKKQIELLGLPRFPTTTIGSFPQTKEVRQMRAKFRKGEISAEEYENFIKEQIKKAIEIQEELELDVFVHGEFERTDMVEFFGQKMDGFAFTKNGWVQSYGTRCVRPPIIYGDVSRPEPMTIKEIVYAQSLTEKPVKGMLTGPVTILNWSFYRKDIPKKDIAYQIAIALRDEVLDLEKAGIKVIQIDEPAFREGLPLKKRKQEEYLNWAVKAFRLTNNTVAETTQIHTHMCYSEFNEIIEWIYAMDSDVISIEASRSKGEIIEAFEKFNYDHGIGVGVYDIHSPRVPPVEEMLEIAERTVQVIDKNLIWINPDCGLKTRGWEETIPALKNMVQVAKILREKYGEKYDW